MSRWISGETTRTRRRFNFIIKLKRNIIIARVKARAVFDFYLISRFSPVSPMYDPSGSPPSGCPISHLFLAARRASSPPVCGCSRLHLCLLEVQRYQKSAIRCITWCVVQCCGIKLDCCSGRNPESFHQRGIICIFHRDILLSTEYQYGISCGNIDSEHL